MCHGGESCVDLADIYIHSIVRSFSFLIIFLYNANCRILAVHVLSGISTFCLSDVTAVKWLCVSLRYLNVSCTYWTWSWRIVYTMNVTVTYRIHIAHQLYALRYQCCMHFAYVRHLACVFLLYYAVCRLIVHDIHDGRAKHALRILMLLPCQ